MGKPFAFLSFDKLRFDRTLLPQFFLVFVAFFMMVFIGYYFDSGIVQRNIVSYGDELETEFDEVLARLSALVNESSIADQEASGC